MERAACIAEADRDWFDLGCGLDELLAVCAVCPVRQDCHDHAVTHGIIDGVWGGIYGSRLERAVGRRPTKDDDW